MNKATKLWWKDNWLTATLLMLMAILLPMLFACCQSQEPESKVTPPNKVVTYQICADSTRIIFKLITVEVINGDIVCLGDTIRSSKGVWKKVGDSFQQNNNGSVITIAPESFSVDDVILRMPVTDE